MKIAGRQIGSGQPTYVIAEMSANHGHCYDKALELIRAAKDAGADAIKLQTYTADTLTIDCGNEHFQIGKGTLWEGKNLYQLYEEAYTPWEWQPNLKAAAEELGLDCFSTPFDFTAVDFLEAMDVPAHKIASFELVDLPLIRKIARTGKPVIMSTGMATLTEISEAVCAFRGAGGTQLALLKCNSGYPAPPEEMNLRTIPDMAERFGVPVGLSDHTLGISAAVAAVALGACIIEKHLILCRADGGPDAAFSIEPHEFKSMVDAIREAEKTLGRVNYEPTAKERASRAFRRSLFVVKDMRDGEQFTDQNLRSIRPGHGLAPKHLPELLECRAQGDIPKGTPLAWDLVSQTSGVYTAALIGLGRIAWRFDGGEPEGLAVTHFGAYQRNRHTRVVAAYSPVMQERVDFHRASKVEVSERFEEVLAQRPDIVSICSPTEFHFSQALACLESHIPMIWLEKPPTLSLEELDRLLGHPAYTSGRTKVAINYMRRYSSVYHRLRAVYHERLLGKPITMQVLYSRGLELNGSHFLDFVFSMLDDRMPVDISVADSERSKESPTFVLRFEDGFVVSVCGHDLPYHLNDVLLVCEDGRASVLSGGLEVRVERKVENECFSGFHRLRISPSDLLQATEPNDAFSATLADLIHAHESKTQPLSNLATARRTQEVIETIRRK